MNDDLNIHGGLETLDHVSYWDSVFDGSDGGPPIKLMTAIGYII